MTIQSSAKESIEVVSRRADCRDCRECGLGPFQRHSDFLRHSAPYSQNLAAPGLPGRGLHIGGL